MSLRRFLSDMTGCGIETTATFYYALSGGTLPTDGKTVFTRSRDRVDGKLVPITQRNPSLADAANKVFMRVLAVKPSERFASASSFVNSLAVALADQTVTSTPKPPPEEGSTKQSWLDYWRYVIVPLAVALIGAVAMWLAAKKK